MSYVFNTIRCETQNRKPKKASNFDDHENVIVYERKKCVRNFRAMLMPCTDLGVKI